MGIISFNSVCIIFIHVHTGIDRADIESGPFLVFLSLTKWCIWIPSRFALIFAWWLKWSAQIKQYKSVCIIINANEDEQNQFLAFTCTSFMAHLCQVYLIMGSVTQRICHSLQHKEVCCMSLHIPPTKPVFSIKYKLILRCVYFSNIGNSSSLLTKTTNLYCVDSVTVRPVRTPAPDSSVRRAPD